MKQAPKQAPRKIIGFNVSEKTLNDIANYLSEKPYKEVAGLLQQLQQGVKPIFEPVKVAVPVKKAVMEVVETDKVSPMEIPSDKVAEAIAEAKNTDTMAEKKVE